jgi:hypothetical protein
LLGKARLDSGRKRGISRSEVAQRADPRLERGMVSSFAALCLRRGLRDLPRCRSSLRPTAGSKLNSRHYRLLKPKQQMAFMARSILQLGEWEWNGSRTGGTGRSGWLRLCRDRRGRASRRLTRRSLPLGTSFTQAKGCLPGLEQQAAKFIIGMTGSVSSRPVPFEPAVSPGKKE